MTTLVNPLTFQLNDNGVILNDDINTINGVFVDLEVIKGLDSAPYRETKRDHEGVDGGFLDAEFETGRDISLEGMVYGGTQPLEQFFDKLKANFAPSRDPLPLYFLTETGDARMIFVKPQGVRYDWDSSRRLGMSPVKFAMYAEDPRMYSQTLNTVTIGLNNAASSGFGFNFGFPLSFGGVVAGIDGKYCSNIGNRPTPAVITITGPADTPVIINDDTGDTLTFAISLSVGETLEINLVNHTVRLNGTTNRRNSLQVPNWFLLNPGNTFIRFRAASGSGSATIAFRSAWR